MELHELRNGVELALELVHDTRDILAAEVCASWCEHQVVRLRHDTEHPSDDVQALQAHTTYGISFLVVMANSNGRTVGFGMTSEDLSREGILDGPRNGQAWRSSGALALYLPAASRSRTSSHTPLRSTGAGAPR